MRYLTFDQYDIMLLAAHNAIYFYSKKRPKDFYPCLDKLANYATMITGKYPEPEVMVRAWEKVRELDCKAEHADKEHMIEIFIGPFTYNKDSGMKTEIELLEEELKELLKEKGKDFLGKGKE